MNVEMKMNMLTHFENVTQSLNILYLSFLC